MFGGLLGDEDKKEEDAAEPSPGADDEDAASTESDVWKGLDNALSRMQRRVKNKDTNE